MAFVEHAQTACISSLSPLSLLQEIDYTFTSFFNHNKTCFKKLSGLSEVTDERWTEGLAAEPK